MRLLFLSRLSLGVALCGALFNPSFARADAFSPIAPGDAIYHQLDALSSLGESKPVKPSSNLTRYEAALQVARAAAIVDSKPEALSRSGWRSLRDLTQSLKPELRQLGVNVEDVLTQCARQLDAPTLPSPAAGRGLKVRPNSAPATGSFLNSPSSPASANRGLLRSGLSLPLSGRVQAGVQSSVLDGRNTRSGATKLAGKDASVSLNLGSGLSVRALASQRELGLGADASPALSAPLFSGARQASGFGGGLEISPFHGLRLSTEVERLSTDAGLRGTRVGGGIGLSAWQNRLTLSARMSRLQPEDRALLPATSTELNVGLGVTQRLSLNLLYQGLFSSQSETSRLAGGLNFSF